MISNNSSLIELMHSGVDFLTILISRDEIEQQDITEPMDILNQLLSDKTISKYFKERVEIVIDGYNNQREELWEISEVRDYVNKLDEEFPYWLFFLSKHGTGLMVIIKCQLLPFLSPEGEKNVNGPRLQNYLLKRGFPAMNTLCNIIGDTEKENSKMTERVFNYITGS